MTLTNLPSPNFTGADLSARVNASVTELRAARRFATVAALLADATLAYGSGARAVVEGDAIEAGGFRYDVATSGASDHHLTSAGGVRLYVLAGADGGFNALAWGVVSDASLDQSAAVQKIIDHIGLSAARLGPLTFPAGTYRFNVTLRSDLRITGANRRDTIFRPATDAAVFAAPSGASLVRVTLENARIVGDPAMASQDGLLLAPSGATWCDTINLRNFDITDCGRYGLRAVGTSTTGPFVQKLNLDDVALEQNIGPGLSLSGTVLETTVLRSSLTRNGGTGAGTVHNAELTTQAATQSPARVTFLGCLFNAQNRVGLGGAGLYSEGKDVSLIGCDMENSAPMLHFTSSRASNHVLLNTRFGSSYAATEQVLVEDVTGMEISACRFSQNGGTLPYYIRAAQAPTRIKGLRIASSCVFGVYGGTLPLLQNNAVTMVGATAALPGESLWALRSAAGSGGANLDTILAADGSQCFPHGFAVTIHAQAGATDAITVRSAAGNIVLQGGNTILNDNIKSVTLRYDAFRSRFVG